MSDTEVPSSRREGGGDTRGKGRLHFVNIWLAKFSRAGDYSKPHPTAKYTPDCIGKDCLSTAVSSCIDDHLH